MSITLHPTLGVNPKLTVCPRCGGDGDELIMIGSNTVIRECSNPACRTKLYGFRSSDLCPKCQDRGPHREIGRVGENDRMPSMQPCEKCRTEMQEQRKLVEAGGLYFRCTGCGCQGVIKANAFTAAVRARNNLPIPEIGGVEIDCAMHTFPKD